MPRRDDACPGAENRGYREAWAAYDTAYDTWEHECIRLLQEAADSTPEVVPDNATHLGQPGRPQMPEPPEAPAVPCRIGDPVWCKRCKAGIRQALTDIGDLAALLEAWADGHRGAASGERTVSHRAHAASVSPITDILDELYGVLAKAEADWREASGHTPRPSRARTSEARERTLAYLQEQLARILLHRGSVQFGTAALNWRRVLYHLARSEPVVRSRPGRCPRCGLVSTLATRDDGYTECRDCGRLMDEEEYQRDVVGGADAGVVQQSRAARGERLAG